MKITSLFFKFTEYLVFSVGHQNKLLVLSEMNNNGKMLVNTYFIYNELNETIMSSYLLAAAATVATASAAHVSLPAAESAVPPCDLT